MDREKHPPGSPAAVLAWAGIVLLLVIQSGCRDAATSAPAASAGSPVSPEVPAAPPAHATRLAAPAAVGSSSLDAQLSAAAPTAEVEAALVKISFDGAAPPSLVVQGGGRQAEVARPAPPRHEQWEIRFTAGSSLESYARQLDSFKIELGAIGGENQVTYITDLANPKPTTRTGPAASDRRLYLIWQRGAMSDADEQIAARAGVKTSGKVLVHFLPKEVEDELVRLEDAFARQLNIEKIGKTVFGIRSAGQDTFRFYVIEQKPDLR